MCPESQIALIDTSNIPLSCTVALTQGGVVDGRFRPHMKLGPDDLTHDVFLLKEKWTSWNWVDIYIYICIWYMYACILRIVGKHDWLFLQLICCYFVNANDLRMFFYAKTCVCYEQLYCCRIIGLILGGPWCNIWATEDTIDLINSIQILQPFIILFGKEPSFWSLYYSEVY